MNSQIRLRPVQPADLPIFFTQQIDPDANYMAAFTAKDPTDRAAFDAHWQRLLADATIVKRTILAGDEVAGSIMKYEDEGHPEVTYWLGRNYWGRGIASQALRLFLDEVPDRPMYARAAQDNRASLRVLEKCGFTIVGEDRGYANARRREVDEYLLRLGDKG